MKKLDIKNILVPIDFSEISIQAIPTAKALAQRFGATVHLVNIYEYYYPNGFLTPAAPIPVFPIINVQDARKAAAQRLNELAGEYGLNGRCYAEVGGPVFNEICWIAQKAGADLIVTPTHGRTGFKHVLLGSTAERLVQHSPCPVFVARELRARKPSVKSTRSVSLDTILVPVDFSTCSLAGLSYAIQFADKVAARIVVLHVVDLGMAVTADGYAMYDLSAVEEAKRKEAEERMAGFIQWAKFGRVEHRAVVKVGSAVSTICGFVEEEKIELIIISTHGRTGLKHVVLGSTAEQVVRHAPCSVLAVPSHPQARASQLETEARRTKNTKRSSVVKAVKRPRFKQNNLGGKAHPFPERRKTNKFRESHLKP